MGVRIRIGGQPPECAHRAPRTRWCGVTAAVLMTASALAASPSQVDDFRGTARATRTAASDAVDDANATVWLNIPVFSQILLMPYPRGFNSVFDSLKSGFFIQEFVPKGQTTDNWTEMFTITGQRNRAVQGNLSPADISNAKAGGFESSCPDTFAGTRFRDVPLGPYPADVIVLSCGNVLRAETGKPPTRGYSESAVIIVIRGERDYYTVQWAERGKPSLKPLRIDTALWSDRIQKMMPIRLCPLVPGASQIANCTP